MQCYTVWPHCVAVPGESLMRAGELTPGLELSPRLLCTRWLYLCFPAGSYCYEWTLFNVSYDSQSLNNIEEKIQVLLGVSSFLVQWEMNINHTGKWYVTNLCPIMLWFKEKIGQCLITIVMSCVSQLLLPVSVNFFHFFFAKLAKSLDILV